MSKSNNVRPCSLFCCALVLGALKMPQQLGAVFSKDLFWTILLGKGAVILIKRLKQCLDDKQRQSDFFGLVTCRKEKSIFACYVPFYYKTVMQYFLQVKQKHVCNIDPPKHEYNFQENAKTFWSVYSPSLHKVGLKAGLP